MGRLNESGQYVVEYDYQSVPTIRKFTQSDLFIRALMGPFGSGKSSGCVMEIVRLGCLQKRGPDGKRRTRWAVVRNTYKQLKNTTIKTFLQWFPPEFFGKYNKTDHVYMITAFDDTEIEVMFIALDRPDHVSNLLSLELTGAFVNEARDIPWIIIEALQGRVGRFPAMRDGGPSWYGLIMDTNPPDEDSDWYRFFETENNSSDALLLKQPPGLLAKRNPDGSYKIIKTHPKAENIPNLPPEYYTRQAIGKRSDYIKVFLLNEYGFSMDGKAVFPEYSDNTHYQEDLIPVEKVKIYRGWDFGLTPACVFIQVLPGPRVLIIDEVCAVDMGIENFATQVLGYCATEYPGYKFEDVGDPAGTQKAQTDEKTCFQILKAKGIKIVAGLQSLQIRLESVRKGLTTLHNGYPCLVVGPKAKKVRKGFMGGYHYRRMRISVERYAEEPEKNEYSHPMDAVEYVCTKIFGRIITLPKQDVGQNNIEQRQPDENGIYF